MKHLTLGIMKDSRDLSHQYYIVVYGKWGLLKSNPKDQGRKETKIKGDRIRLSWLKAKLLAFIVV